MLDHFPLGHFPADNPATAQRKRAVQDIRFGMANMLIPYNPEYDSDENVAASRWLQNLRRDRRVAAHNAALNRAVREANRQQLHAHGVEG